MAKTAKAVIKAKKAEKIASLAAEAAKMTKNAANTLDTFSDTMRVAQKYGKSAIKSADNIISEAGSKVVKAMETGGDIGKEASKAIKSAESAVSAGGLRLSTKADDAAEALKTLPAPGQSSLNIGERLVSKDVFENYIKGKSTFQLGAPGTESFFFNQPGANTASRSFEAAVNAGFTKQNIIDTINSGGNELVRIRFDLSKVDQIAMPGVSKIHSGVGEGIIPGTNELFTGKGYTQNYLGQRGFDEYIARNVVFTQDDIISYQYLGKIKK